MVHTKRLLLDFISIPLLLVCSSPDRCLVTQPTLGKLLEERFRDTVEVVKLNEGWEGEWNQHAGD